MTDPRLVVFFGGRSSRQEKIQVTLFFVYLDVVNSVHAILASSQVMGFARRFHRDDAHASGSAGRDACRSVLYHDGVAPNHGEPLGLTNHPWALTHLVSAAARDGHIDVAASQSAKIRRLKSIRRLACRSPASLCRRRTSRQRSCVHGGVGLLFDVWEALVVAALREAASTLQNVLWFTIQYRLVPDRLLRRVSSIDWTISLIGLPLSYAVVGPLAKLIVPATPSSPRGSRARW
jgi:hypothetical protein